MIGRIVLFDESDDDLIRRADAAAINRAIVRVRNAEHGFKGARVRELQAEVLRQLRQDSDNESRD